MAHAWHIVLVGSIVFGVTGLIAMQQPGNNGLNCSAEFRKENAIVAKALRNSSGSRAQKNPDVYYPYCGGKPEYPHGNNNGVYDPRESMKPYFPGQ